MAAGAFKVLEIAQLRLGRAEFDFSAHGFALVLCGSAQALTPDFVGSSGGASYSDLTDELPNGNGYVTGGEALAGVTWAASTDYKVFDANDVVFEALGDPTPVDVKYGVIIDTTLSDPPIVGFFDVNTSSGSGTTVSGQDYTVQWNANGIFRLSQNPPN